MIVDYRANPKAAELFSVIDEATGKVIDKSDPYWYADDSRSIVRRYDQDERGHYFTCSPVTKSPLKRWLEDGRCEFQDGTTGDVSETAWSEYHRDIRIVPREDLDSAQAELAGKLMAHSA